MLTQLDIINDMLAATGTAPLTASDDQHPMYIKANSKLQRVSTAVQNLGLWFNTTYPTLLPNGVGEVVVPNGTLSCDPIDGTNYTPRRGKMYDLMNRTYVLNKPIKCKLVSELAYEDMPQTALDYLREKARLEFYTDEDGTEPKLSVYTRNMQLGWTLLWREHLKNRDINYFSGNNMNRFYRRNYGPTRLPGPQE